MMDENLSGHLEAVDVEDGIARDKLREATFAQRNSGPPPLTIEDDARDVISGLELNEKIQRIYK